MTPLYVFFVDFKKAYDCVWRQALLYKLLMMNINGLFFNILKSVYANNEICVRVSNFQRSRFFTSNVGVRQGDAISPVLFNLYVSDLQSYLGFDTDAPLLDTSYVNCLMYADDLVLVSRSEEGLQGLIDKFGEMSTDDGHKVYFSGEEGKHEYGVGFLVHKDLVGAVLGCQPVSSRLISIRLRAAPLNITIIQVYAPTSGHDDSEVDHFYQKLQETIDQTPKKDILVVQGDWNAKVGKDAQADWGEVCGPYCNVETNERGLRLLEFATFNNLVLTTRLGGRNHPWF